MRFRQAPQRENPVASRGTPRRTRSSRSLVSGRTTRARDSASSPATGNGKYAHTPHARRQCCRIRRNFACSRATAMTTFAKPPSMDWPSSPVTPTMSSFVAALHSSGAQVVRAAAVALKGSPRSDVRAAANAAFEQWVARDNASAHDARRRTARGCGATSERRPSARAFASSSRRKPSPSHLAPTAGCESSCRPRAAADRSSCDFAATSRR